MTWFAGGLVAVSWGLVLTTDLGRHVETPPAPPAVTVVEPLTALNEGVETLRREIAASDAELARIERDTAGLAVDAVGAACEAACDVRQESGRTLLPAP